MAKTDDIARSIARKLGDEELAQKLADLDPSDLSALLLDVYARHCPRHAWPKAADRFASAPMYAASTADARALHRVDGAFLAAAHAAGFECVELAPVVPQGLGPLTGISSNNVLGTLRAGEVLADPTAAMALEVIRRLRAMKGDRAALTNRAALASSSRVLRMQPLPKGAAHFSQHFRIHALVTSVRSRDQLLDGLVAHVRVWCRTLRALAVEPTRVSLAGDRATYDDLAARLPDIPMTFDDTRTQGRAYYANVLLTIAVRAPDGAEVLIGDGGLVDWTGRALSDARERLVTSGLGAEALVKRLLPPAPTG